jgi:hypothetical protein
MNRAHLPYQNEFIYTQHPVPHSVAWYKWEFLRRNSTYGRDYRKFKDKFGGWFGQRGYWYDYDRREEEWTEADEDYFYAEIAPEVARLCRKWLVGNLFPPDWRFSRKNGTRMIGSRELSPPTAIAPELNWDPGYMRELLEMGFTGTADSAFRYRNMLQLELDLDRPLKDLVKYAQYVLIRANENYKEELQSLGVKVPKSRRRLKDYDTHLKIWDYDRKHKTVPQIAAIVFPNENRENAIQKVRDQLRATEKLISGGYAEIR